MDNVRSQGKNLLRESRVAILGLGLIGGSLALALRGKCAGLFGIDPDPRALSLARGSGAFDEVYAEPTEVLRAADAVILAAPVQVILRLLGQLPAWHPGRAIVMDVGSTKTRIVARMDALPPRFEAIGGHPMAGKEHGGFANAAADLFQGAPFVLSPSQRTTPRALSFALEVVDAVGAHPVMLDPVAHDRQAAAISHLPYLLSLALALATPPEAALIAGPGWLSTTRLASTPPQMMGDILATNREAVLAALTRFRRVLDELESALKGGDFLSLQGLMRQGKAKRESLLLDRLNRQ